MTPRVVSCWFGPYFHEQWSRLVRVLEWSAEQHCTGWTIDIRQLPPYTRSSATGVEDYVSNTEKLDAWARIVDGLSDGERVLLIDADVLILKPLDDVWDLEFDVAYTVKPKASRYPFNGGVLFLRVSDQVKAFLRTWADENTRMFEDPAYHQVWRAAYGGLNQAALGAILKEGRAPRIRFQRLPCLEWNCEDDHWASFDPTRTRILHVKSHLRRAIFGQQKPERYMKPLMELWRSAEACATGATAKSA